MLVTYSLMKGKRAFLYKQISTNAEVCKMLVPDVTAVQLNQVTPWKVPRAGKGTLHSIFTNGTCATPFSYVTLGRPW